MRQKVIPIVFTPIDIVDQDQGINRALGIDLARDMPHDSEAGRNVCNGVAFALKFHRARALRLPIQIAMNGHMRRSGFLRLNLALDDRIVDIGHANENLDHRCTAVSSEYTSTPGIFVALLSARTTPPIL